MPTSKTILIISDESAVSASVQALLEEAGYRTIRVVDGARGAEEAEKLRPDLVVLDRDLPGVNWRDDCVFFVRTLGIPVIVLHDSWDGMFPNMSVVDSVLTKPFNPLELLAFVKRIFRSIDSISQDSEETRKAPKS